MLADKTLLSVTLAATFTSGMFVGYAVKDGRRGAGAPPTDPSVIYAPQLEELAAKGYDDAELAEARQIYADYLKGYGKWVNEYIDLQRPVFDQIDEKKDKRLADLEARHVAREGAK
jgi:hypothetical protein